MQAVLGAGGYRVEMGFPSVHRQMASQPRAELEAASTVASMSRTSMPPKMSL